MDGFTQDGEQAAANVTSPPEFGVAVTALPISAKRSILDKLEGYTTNELRRLVADLIARPKVGLYWERNAVERDRALNDAHVFLTQVPELSRGSGPFGNLVIEGDNFDALRLLRTTHAGRIRVIFIDPPYNTGKNDFVYNDRYINKDDRDRQSTWLDWLYRRLKLAHDLLTPDGVMLLCINDENRSRLELLMDAVFPGGRVGSFVWKSRKSTNDEGDHNFSSDHEHVLVYGKPEFSFKGVAKKNSDYKFKDPDGRLWASAPLNVSVRYDTKKAGNAFYPLHDPKTDIYYPCNPDSVWRYASRERLKPGQKLKASPMEELVEQGRVSFPREPRVATWDSVKKIRQAIDRGEVPFSNGRPLIRQDLEDEHLKPLVGKRIGWGRPRLKRYLDEQESDHQPVSSWVRSESLKEKAEADDAGLTSIASPYSDSGNKTIEAIFGSKVFTTAKPVALVQNLLRTFCGEDDIVLDFFAGSGTTGHAICALNEEDGGSRRFIMVSSTEATRGEPGKNVCRDACAARLRKVMDGYGKADGLDGEFAYLRVTRIAQADLPFEMTPEMAWNTLCLRYGGVVVQPEEGPVARLPSDDDTKVVLLLDPDEEVLRTLTATPDERLVVLTDRLGAVAEALAEIGVVEILGVDAVVMTAAVPLEDE